VRIVNLVTQMEAGGAQQVAINLTAALIDRGYEAEAWFLYEKRPTYRSHRGVRSIFPRQPKSIMDYMRIFWGLLKLLRLYKPSAVITHTYYANIMGQTAAYLTGVRARLAVQHNPAGTYPKLGRFLDLLIGSAGFYNHNVVVSRAVFTSFDRHPYRYKRFLRIIYNGIPALKPTLDKESARRRRGLPLDGFIIVNTGRLAAQKNQRLLIKLITRLPVANVHLAIAGDGELRPLIEKEARFANVAHRMHLLGEIPPGEMPDFLIAGDVFVFPSVYEATGLAMVEAMQMGLPVIASDIPGLQEVLDNKEGAPAGIMVNPEDEEGFGRAVAQLLEDRALAGALADRARSRAKDYSLTRMVDGYEQCFLELINEAG